MVPVTVKVLDGPGRRDPAASHAARATSRLNEPPGWPPPASLT
jgi:hypothetical protein